MLAHIDLDIAYAEGELPDEAVLTLVDTEDIQYVCIDDAGVGGGWPVYRFAGEPEALGRLLYRYCDGVQLDVVMYLRYVEEGGL